MKEIKNNPGTVVGTKKVVKYLTVWKFKDGMESFSAVLSDSYESEKACDDGLADYCLERGDQAGAERWSTCKYFVFPVTIEVPVVKWDDEEEEAEDGE